MNRALFLDRDGVINEDYGYVHKIEDFHFREGIFDVCRAAQQARMKIIVVTNQAGIGRGFYNSSDYRVVTEYMISRFASENAQIASVYHCPYHPRAGLGHFKYNSFDRKPYPGMLIQACRDHHINPSLSIMIGDKDTDKLAAACLCVKYYLDSKLASWQKDALRLIASI